VALILALLLPLGAAPEAVLSERLQQFPEWQLPAPLPRPRRGDLEYPSWFEGRWQLEASDGVSAQVRFKRRNDGAVVGERAGNAMAIGRAVLGDALLEVEDDPSNPNRQLARLSDERQLDTRITGRLSEQPSEGEFLADELSPDNCRLWDSETDEKLDKDRFRRDLGSLIDGYSEIAHRLGLKIPSLDEG